MPQTLQLREVITLGLALPSPGDQCVIQYMSQTEPRTGRGKFMDLGLEKCVINRPRIRWIWMNRGKLKVLDDHRYVHILCLAGVGTRGRTTAGRRTSVSPQPQPSSHRCFCDSMEWILIRTDCWCSSTQTRACSRQ